MPDSRRHDRGPARRGAHVPAADGVQADGPRIVDSDVVRRRRPRTTRASGPRQAAELLDWFEEWDTILDWDLPFAKWFVGGQAQRRSTTASTATFEAGHGDQVAYHWEGEPGDTRTITYADCSTRSARIANALKSLGVAQGRPGQHLPGHGARAARSRCWRAPASARRTRSCSAASRPTRCATGSTTPRPRCSSPPTARGAGARSCRSRRSPTPRWPRRRRSSAASCCGAPANDVSMQEGRDVWWHDVVPAPVGRLPARADGRRGPALPPLHERDHRASPRASCTRPAATSRRSRGRTSNVFDISPRHRRLLVRGRRAAG